MNILIVDDDEVKSNRVTEAIGVGSSDVDSNKFTVVRTLSDALRVLNTFKFDLIVLDLMLPYVRGGSVDSQAGVELLRQMRLPECKNHTTTVLGLSAFVDEIEAVRGRFEELGVLITAFDDESTWRTALGSILRAIRVSGDQGLDLEFLAICALEEERTGYDSLVVESSRAVVSGLNVQYVRLTENRDVFGAIVKLNNMGLVAATHETAIALRTFRPKVLCMSGICAGFAARTELGQLVFASPAWEYQAGKWSKDGFQIAPLQVSMRRATRTVIDQAIGADAFGAELEGGLRNQTLRPSRRVRPILGPFATGSAVIADAGRLAHIEEQHRKVAALDMETYGVYYAASESARQVEHYFSVKTVVDFADKRKDDDLHDYGCAVSASAAVQMIRRLVCGD